MPSGNIPASRKSVMWGEMFLAGIRIRGTSKIAECRMRDADFNQILFLLVQTLFLIPKSAIRN